MLGVKVLLERAEEIKKFLIKNKIMNFNYQSIKEKDAIIFPIIKTFEDKDVEFLSKTFPKKNKAKNWNELLKEKLTDKEFKKAITAHDVVGTIAIIEIPSELKKKGKIIAEALLKANKNIKTVLKKAGEHTGVFRTQEMNWLAGQKTKETVHKENNTQIKINVEEIYFSTRLSTERKRIMHQIKKGENVLVMFSGAGPYPIVFSKNTSANSITGIEINEKAHEVGEENIVINRAGNVNLIRGDVKKVLPNIYQYNIGLKSNIKKESVDNRLKQKPRIFELFLTKEDVLEKKKLEETIDYLKKNGVEEIYLHTPHINKKEKITLEEDELLKVTFKLLNIVKKHKVNAIIHPSNKNEKYTVLIKNIKLIKSKYPEEFENNIYFENLINPSVFSDEKRIKEIAKKTGIKNVCIDPAHFFLSKKNNDQLEQFIKEIKSHFKTYFHLNSADYDARDGLEINNGCVNIKRILYLVNKGIVEVKILDETKGTEMINSYNLLGGKKLTFDRICMPLPKSAEDFLDDAISVSKKGTIIHFYDFLHIDEFEKCEEKVKNACKKSGLRYELLKFVKCGQYSPRKFRVCLDFKIL